MADYDFSPAATCIPLQEPKRPLENANTPTDQRPKRHSCSLLSGSKGQLENADPSASQYRRCPGVEMIPIGPLQEKRESGFPCFESPLPRIA